MKRIGNIFDAIASRENLERAFFAVRKHHVRSSSIARFAKNFAANISGLAGDLQSGDFRFGAYHYFKIYDPKERTIAAAPVRERILHHAVMNHCGERLEKALIEHTYACRKGKGQWAALEAATACSRRHPWCLKLDVRRYFDSIDHGVLLAALSRLFKDTRLLALFEALVSTYHTTPGKGLPIGNLTSQYFANLYLSPVDRLAAQSGRFGYVRYMDDMLLFGKKTELLSLRRDIESLLQDKLFLGIKHGGSLHGTSRGVDFLGCRVFPSGLRLASRSRRRFFSKLRLYDALFEKGALGELVYQHRLEALFAFARHARTDSLRRAADLGRESIPRQREQQGRIAPRGAREEPRTTGGNRVLRGGSWNNNAQNCRSANRNNNDPGNRNNNIGFRVALAPAARLRPREKGRATMNQGIVTDRGFSRSRPRAGQIQAGVFSKNTPAKPGLVGASPNATASPFLQQP